MSHIYFLSGPQTNILFSFCIKFWKRVKSSNISKLPICCIFWPAFWSCKHQTVFKICIFHGFQMKNGKRMLFHPIAGHRIFVSENIYIVKHSYYSKPPGCWVQFQQTSHPQPTFVCKPKNIFFWLIFISFVFCSFFNLFMEKTWNKYISSSVWSV